MSVPIHVAVAEAPFDPEAEHRAFRAAVKGAGAIAAFTGLVRDKAADETVTALELQHYPGFTEKEMRRIAGVAAARWPLVGVHIIHRAGKLPPDEPIVFAAAASAHRRAAFEAADFLMDYLKTEAPFWKKEYRGARAAWIEPRAEDYDDKARWRPTNDQASEEKSEA